METIKTDKLTYHQFLLIQDCIANVDDLFIRIKAMPKPSKLRGKDTPDNLNSITYGQYIELSQAGENLFTLAPSILLGVDVTNEPCGNVLRFGQWVAEELANIAKLFATTAIEPTAEEKEAKVEDMNVGVFGTIDWFAQRMHISHEEVTNTSWMIIYKCLDIEARKVRFNRRLREVQSRHNKLK